MKTQQAGGASGGAGEANDINDPIVQDVLNEFQEELMLSKQPRAPLTSQQPPYMPQPPQHPPHPQHPQHSQHPPMSPHYPSYPSSPYGYSKYDNLSSYLDTEVAKKSLIFYGKIF